MTIEHENRITGDRREILAHLLPLMGEVATPEEAERLYELLETEGAIGVAPDAPALLELNLEPYESERAWLTLLDRATATPTA